MPEGAVADEFVGAERREGHDRVDKRHVPRLREAGRDADHVLLRDPDVEEAVRMPLHERLERHVAEVAREQRHAAILVGQLDQRADERAPHQPVASSASAKAYSASDMGQ